jgi:hypothetical protein
VPAAASGSITAFYLYDVADAIDLGAVGGLVSATASVHMAPKLQTPSYIAFKPPPISIEGIAIGVAAVEGFAVRFRLFDYGVVSVALTRPMLATWGGLLAEGLSWHDHAGLAAGAERACRLLVGRIAAAVTRPRAELLSEDYLVFAMTSAPSISAADLLAAHGGEVAQLLRGERDVLSEAERAEVLRHRLSYFATDLIVPTWNAAFVYDAEDGARATLDIIEFANSQLLEFRYYDQLLDAELERIYPQLQQAGGLQSWFGRRLTRAARQLHTLFIEVNQVTDKTENALKIAGDVYTARLFTLVAARLGLDDWKGSVREKLKTLDDIYRFAVEQTAMARGELLELTIVLILVLELVLFFLGIMR